MAERIHACDSSGQGNQGRIPFELFIGGIGHRSLPDDPVFQERLRACIARLGELRPSSQVTAVELIAVTSLAEGADRAIAETVLTAGGGLEVVLPMPSDSYVIDFETRASQQEFHELLDRADRVIEMLDHPASQDEREAGYEAAGRTVIERCDILLVVWDGETARGRGGTEEMVKYARSLRKPLIRLETWPPFSAYEENIFAPFLPEAFEKFEMFNHDELREDRHQAGSARACQELLSEGFRRAELQPLCDWITPRYVRADQLALRYQKRFNLLSTSVYFLAFLATVIGALQLIYLPDRPLAALPELLLLIVILVVFALEQWRSVRAHDRWMAYRFLAERLRSAFFLAVADVRSRYDLEVPRTQLSEETERWLPRALAHVYTRCPRVETQAIDVPATAGYLTDVWVGSQSRYHVKAQRRHRRSHALLSALLYAVFALTMVALIIHVSGSFPEGSGIARILFLAAIALPALGGAVSGMRSQRDAERHAIRHRDMQIRLEDEGKKLRQSASPGELRRRAMRVEECMIGENAEWLRQIRFTTVELPVG